MTVCVSSSAPESRISSLEIANHTTHCTQRHLCAACPHRLSQSALLTSRILLLLLKSGNISLRSLARSDSKVTQRLVVVMARIACTAPAVYRSICPQHSGMWMVMVLLASASTAIIATDLTGAAGFFPAPLCFPCQDVVRHSHM